MTLYLPKETSWDALIWDPALSWCLKHQKIFNFKFNQATKYALVKHCDNYYVRPMKCVKLNNQLALSLLYMYTIHV